MKWYVTVTDDLKIIINGENVCCHIMIIFFKLSWLYGGIFVYCGACVCMNLGMYGHTSNDNFITCCRRSLQDVLIVLLTNLLGLILIIKMISLV